MKKPKIPYLFLQIFGACLFFAGCVSHNSSSVQSTGEFSKLVLNKKYSRTEYTKHFTAPPEVPSIKESNPDSRVQLYESEEKLGTSFKIKDESQLRVKDSQNAKFEFVKVKFRNVNQALGENGKVLREHNSTYEYGENILGELNSIPVPVPFSEIKNVLFSAKPEEYERVESGESPCTDDLSRTAWVTDLTVRDSEGNEMELQVYEEFFMAGTECP